jgi:hypothetical protein
MTLKLTALSIAATSLFGCTALLAARGAGHWFWRLSVAAGLVLALAFISAQELIVMFLVEFATIACGFNLWNVLRLRSMTTAPAAESGGSSQHVRFGIRDLLLAMPFAGGLAADVPRCMKLWEDNPWGAKMAVMAGFMGGVVSLAAAWAVFVPYRRRWRVVGMVVVVLGVAGYVVTWSLSPISAVESIFVVVGMTLAEIVFLWLGARSGLFEIGGCSVVPDVRRRQAQGALAALVLVMTSPCAALVILLAPRAVSVSPAVPRPNGLDVAAAAHEQIKWTPMSTQEYEDLSDAELMLFEQTNELALENFRASLNLAWRVPLAWSDDDIQVSRYQDWRSDSRALAVAGLAAERDGRFDRAVRFYGDILRFGAAAPRGGLMVDRLVGDAIGHMGAYYLAQITPQLDTAQCHLALAEIDHNMALREPYADVLERELLWDSRNSPWYTRLVLLLEPSMQNQLAAGFQVAEDSLIAKVNLLRAEVAIHAYFLEEGDEPPSLADLVPQYLSSTPLDPFTRRPLIYRREDAGHALYSTGPDGRDDGGMNYNQDDRGEDMFIDK